MSLSSRILVVAVLAVVAAGTTGLLMARFRPAPEAKPEPGEPPTTPEGTKDIKELAKQFPSWKGQKPELVIVCSGEQHNYEAPCGCTDPQYGGLERRYNVIKQLRDAGIPVVPLDLGDIYYPGKFTDQARLKYAKSMQALNIMQYAAVAVGPEEFRVPLIDALADTVLNGNYSFEVLAANIASKDNFPAQGSGSMLKDYRVVDVPGGRLKVGVVGVLGKSVIDELKKRDPSLDPQPDPVTKKKAEPSIKFENNIDAIPRVMKAVREQNPAVRVLLYEGSADEAKVLAQTIDEFDIILCRSEESEPRAAEAVPPLPGRSKPRAKLAFVGHKGRYIGVLAAFRNGDGLDLRWELLRLGPELASPAEGRENHPIVKLLEEYTQTLKDGDYISRKPKLDPRFPKALPGNDDKAVKGLKYVGSKACQECHKAEYEVWENTRHSDAYPTLFQHPKSHPPHNRQFDPECVSCHTVGFGYASGFGDREAGLNDPKKAEHLLGVGCETCHGPGSLHASNPKNAGFQAPLSPWRDKKTIYLVPEAVNEKEKAKLTDEQQDVANRVFKLCFQCHDTDNDHNFQLDKWKKIAHGGGPTVRKKKN